MMNELATKHSLVSIIFMIIAVVLSVGCSAESSTLEAVIAEDSIVTPVLGETSIRPVDNVAMVYVPDGRLQMGSNQRQINIAGELCDAHPDSYGKCASETFELEIPQHPVDIDAFWIDQTEVAVSQYHLCVEAGDCSPSRLAGDPDYYSDTYPVAGIPWGDAVNYCEWVGGRLPYEAEWEYAARGSSGLIFPWGNDFD
jgi:formylglycine-generating enzyme required for sulfatase activity